MSRSRTLFLILPLLLAALACIVPSATPAAQPSVDDIVTQTIAALTETPPATASPLPGPASNPTSSLLARSLYFLAPDAAAHLQVFRLAADGQTLAQITAEPADVKSYDVNQNDGRVLYISNNQLLLINADGSGRQVLLEAGVSDVNNPFLTDLRTVAWSPNGKTIAYGLRGLNLYSMDSGVSNLVLPDQTRDVGGGIIFPDELYWPDRFSPDGTKLLLTLGYYEGASAAVYDPAGNSLVRLSGAEGAMICCGNEVWSTDGAALYAASPHMGMFNSGLWRINAATGQVTTLLAGDPGNGTYNFANAPFPAPDGQLYFFFANLPSAQEFVNRPPLQIVRSGLDGVAGRTVLLPDTFEMMNEALWAPDASFVIVASAQTEQMYEGGLAEIVYLDGRPRIQLIPYAYSMRWGP